LKNLFLKIRLSTRIIERQKMTNVSENVASLTFVDCTMNKQYCL